MERGKYRRVFERYNFPYDSESVREIFTNVNPDLVIFLGAYDTNYDWSDARRESAPLHRRSDEPSFGVCI